MMAALIASSSAARAHPAAVTRSTNPAPTRRHPGMSRLPKQLFLLGFSLGAFEHVEAQTTVRRADERCWTFVLTRLIVTHGEDVALQFVNAQQGFALVHARGTKRVDLLGHLVWVQFVFALNAVFSGFEFV